MYLSARSLAIHIQLHTTKTYNKYLINVVCCSSKKIKLNDEIEKENEAPLLPTVSSLQEENLKLRQIIQHYKKTLNNKCSLLSKSKKKCLLLKKKLLQSKSTNSVTQSSKMTKVCEQFIKSQEKLSSKHKLGRRYETSDKELALALYYCSTKSYTLLQKYFCLPSLSSLRSWLNNLHVSCGLNSTVLELLKIKAKKLSSKEKVVSLVFDEMSLKEVLNYDARRDIFEGFQDFGDHCLENLKLCNQAMVFMIKGIYIDFKQVVGYFLSKDAMPGDILHKLFLDIIGKIFDTGFIIKSIVCDLGSNNVKLRKLLSVSINEPYINYRGNKIYFFYDPPHLLKCIRNNFKNYDFQYHEAIASWSHIEDFYKIDSQQIPRMAPRLIKKCVTLPPFSPMRVCLAARVFSHSVNVGILCNVTLNNLPASATHTADFIGKIDTLFDIFNSCKYKECKKYRRPISIKSDHINKLDELRAFLEDLVVLNKKKINPLCINGWISNIVAIKMLWEDLKSNYDFKFLFTRRLTQDCIENLFSIIRYKGGNNVTPDCTKFRCSLRSVMANQLLQPSSDSNSEIDACEFLLQKELILQKDLSLPIVQINKAYNNEIVQYPVDMSEKNSECYVLGWVCSQLLHDDCRNLLCSLSNDYSIENTQIELKKYDNSSRLFFPNENAKRMSDNINKVFKENVDEYIKISVNNVKARLCSNVNTEDMLMLICKECTKLFLDKYFNVLIKAYVNKINDTKENRIKNNRKLKKITHS